MRPVAPLPLKGLKAADLTGQDGPDFDLVAPADLWIDDAYQRSLSPKSLELIRRIVETWCWSKFKPPICARVDGKLHVIDGQHTAIAAATHGGILIIPVVVVAAPDLAHRAQAFVSHATDRLITTPGQVWHAAVLAGDEDAVTIDNVCRRAGVELVQFPPAKSAYKPGQTIAIRSIRRLIDRRGAMRAREVLQACAAAELAPISADHVKVAETLLCEDDYRDEFDIERVATALRSLGSTGYLEARQLAISKHLPMWRALTAVLCRQKRPKGKAKSDIGMPITEARVPAPPPGFVPVRVPVAKAEPGTKCNFGEPPVGRSALDQRTAGA